MKYFYAALIAGSLFFTGLWVGTQRSITFAGFPVSTVAQGGTGWSAFTLGSVLIGSGTSLPGSLQFSTSTITISTTTNSLGIATSSPATQIDIFSTGTSSLRVDSNASSKGGCIVIKDSDGSGYLYVSGKNGSLTTSAISCL